MSGVTKLADKLKSAPTVTSLSGLSIPCVSSSGELQKTFQVVPSVNTPICSDANDASPGWMRTNPGTVNIPVSGTGSFLLTLQYDTVARIQFFFRWLSIPAIWARQHSSGSAVDKWGNWTQIAP